jgi:hypothetical protein
MVFDILSEPAGRAYHQLLDECAVYSTTVLLVVRDTQYLSPSATAFLETAEPWRLSKELKSEWPGTIMKEFLATIYTYRFDDALLRKLQTTATRLYQWVQPELPEDPCFLRPDGRPLLVTIAHESDSYLDITESEADRLMGAIPSLKLSRRR